MEEYKVGEVFQFGKKKLKCVLGTCDKCVMRHVDSIGCDVMSDYLGNCKANDRSDNKNVIFIEVEETDKQEGDEMKQTVEEAAHSFAESRSSGSMFTAYYDGFVEGAEWKSNQYE